MLTHKHTYNLVCTLTQTTRLVSHKSRAEALQAHRLHLSPRRRLQVQRAGTHSSRGPGGSHQGIIQRGTGRPNFPHCKTTSQGAGMGRHRECMANGSLGKSYPTRTHPRVAKESPGPTQRGWDLCLWNPGALCRQPEPAGLAVQADSSRQEPVLVGSVSHRSHHRRTPRAWELAW